jgi:hypothetical protein
LQHRQGIETCVPIIVPKVVLSEQSKVAAKEESNKLIDGDQPWM